MAGALRPPGSYPRVPVRILASLTLLAVCLAGAGRLVHATEGVYEGNHVHVDGNVDAAWRKVAGDLGDELFGKLAEDLGARPPASELPLRLTLYPTRVTFERAVLPLTLREKDASLHQILGGWTRRHPPTSHVWLQADAFDTRRLILHELVHQFYARCREPSRRGQGAFWYREGLAEYYGWHRRTAAGLAYGAFDALARGARLEALKLRIAKKDWSAFAVGTRARGGDYTDATALFGALRGTAHAVLRERLARYEREVLRRGGGAATFGRLFRDLRPALEAAVKSYWAAVEPRWITHGVGWDEDAGVLHARGTGIAVLRPARVPAPWSQVRMDVSVPKGSKASVGFVLHTPGIPHADRAFLVERGRLTVARFGNLQQAAREGAAVGALAPNVVASVSLPSQATYRLRLSRLGGAFVLAVDTAAGERRVVLPAPKGAPPRRAAPDILSLVARGGPARCQGLVFDAPPAAPSK